MYCPKCSSPAVEGQRFCRQCGTNLGAIVDAMEGRRGPVDFERLKVDLKDLGNSLRSGFEQAHQEFKKKQHSYRQPHEQTSRREQAADVAKTSSCATIEATSALFTSRQKRKRSRESRRYHLQKGILSIFSGSAVTGAYYLFLQTAAESGLLASLERIVLQNNPDLTGLLPVVQMLWVFGLIPVATGLGHLINGAFFAPSEKELRELESIESFPQTPPESLPWATPQLSQQFPAADTRVTNEFNPELTPGFSITEDPTLPLGQREQKRQAG
jgi:hypothetical protein